MEARLGDVVPACEQAVVQLLDVHELRLDLQPAQVDAALEQSVKRERVVRAGRDAKADPHWGRMVVSASRTAARDRVISQPARSRSPAAFETPRIIRHVAPASIAARATAKPSISSSSAPGFAAARSSASVIVAEADATDN